MLCFLINWLCDLFTVVDLETLSCWTSCSRSLEHLNHAFVSQHSWRIQVHSSSVRSCRLCESIRTVNSGSILLNLELRFLQRELDVRLLVLVHGFVPDFVQLLHTKISNHCVVERKVPNSLLQLLDFEVFLLDLWSLLGDSQIAFCDRLLK